MEPLPLVVVVPLPDPVVPEALVAVCVTFERVPLSSPDDDEVELSSSESDEEDFSSAAVAFGFDIL